MSQIVSWATLVNVMLAIGVMVVGLAAFKRIYARDIAEIQTRVIAALRSENEASTRQITTLQTEVSDLQSVLATIRIVLKDRGILIRINRDTVEFEDVAVPRKTVRRILKGDAQRLATKDDTAYDGAEDT